MQEGLGLRPLGVGDIVDRVFGIYRARPLMLLVISAIPYLLLALVVGASTLAFSDALVALATALGGDVAVDALARVAGRLLLFLAVVVLTALAVSLVQSASLIEATGALYLGKGASVEGAIRAGLRAAPRLFGMGALALVAFCALWIAAVLVMVVAGQWWTLVLGSVAGLAASTYLAASWMVSPAVVTLEGAGPLTALRRSWWLSQGQRWRIVGLIVLLVILQFVLSSLLSFFLITSFATDRGVQILLQQAVNLVATIAWAPAYWGTFAVLYYDLRVRKEALDLQLAAEALPREG